MHRRQDALNASWEPSGLPPFGMGIGVSTGDVAAALLGSEERLEYTLVGDTVNMSQRLQDLARPAGTTVLSDATRMAAEPRRGGSLGAAARQGPRQPVVAHRLLALRTGDPSDTPRAGSLTEQ